MKERVLVADDDRISREFLAELVRRRGAEVVEAHDGAAALRALEKGRFDLVLSDVRMPGCDGVEVARRAKASGSPVLLLTAHGSLESAVEALRAGADDYLPKPIDPDALERAIDRAQARRRPNAAPARSACSAALVGRSGALLETLSRIERAAPSKATVLLEGESGTGKELLAALIHESSPRRSGPFIKVNCAALAPGVLESELFGHERGAFTGAVERRAGRFELAHGGTILLDEVSEVSTAIQAKLLRVLEEEEIERVGGTKTLRLDVRVIATTNRDLRQEIALGNFRADLYFRLAVVPVRVPPLRERAGDLPILVEHFIERYRAEVPSSRVRAFSREALDLVERHDWPGNVRELENLVRRAVVLDPGEVVRPEDLRADLVPRAATPLATGTIDASERETIARALAETNGNRTRAARVLGISVRTLFNRLKRYEVEAGNAFGLFPVRREAIA
jgi:DNA-binding NtrC family response regulator